MKNKIDREDVKHDITLIISTALFILLAVGIGTKPGPLPVETIIS
ncbi:hypothetical protein CLPU_21c00060 [Gottschalkia purinilytica]|uniref:Uncharacterized protein n=1 Tax=Gottschalkia purinilytica TaxID=1503 RepID=A0A0L0W6N1_GOTPU|nr:hypothetical protein [Gottschalkia purinilytica]KNF07188.1 hypothetical protein CLPU_21c00060 [Gottschalkia purinilytica]